MKLQDSAWRFPVLESTTAPAFVTEQQCLDWLAALPLTNAAQAHEQLMRQLMLLNRFNVAADERLKILEALRSPIHFVHGESIKRYAARPLPLAPLEQASFDASLALWQELAIGYLHCLQAWSATQPAAGRASAACVAARALTAMLAIYIDHSRTAILPEAAYWRRLHSLYREAEALELAMLPVEDKLRHTQPTTVSAAYVETLLLEAAHLHELRPKHIDLVAHWAKRWAGKVAILFQPPADPRTPPLCVDLTGARPAVFEAAAADAAHQRWLDMSQLRKHIKHHLLKLAEGAAAEDQTQDPLRERLLRQVYQDWCKGGRKPSSTERAADQDASACQLLTSFEAIHYFLSGQTFQQPGHSVYLNKRQCDEIATLGQRATHRDIQQKMSQTGAHPYSIENWRVATEDLRSMRLMRPLDQPGGRLTSGQLVALRAHATDSFQLGVVRWVAQDGGRKQLCCAIDLLPGVPTAATLLNAETGGTLKDLYCRGFCLPALAQLGEAASILMPTGWFRPGRIIEVQTDVLQKIRCTRLIERGSDFERGCFESV